MSHALIRRPAGALTLVLAAVLGVSALALPYTVDDAFIVARYAQNLVAGVGYGMNPGVSSDGVTGPLWIAPAYAALRLGLEPLIAAKVVGAGCAALAAAIVVIWTRARALGQVAGWASACVLACLADVGTWAISGLETGAALLATTLLAVALLRRAPPRWATAIVATTALAWLRPELAPCVSVLWLARVLRGPRAAAPWLLLALLGALSVVAWRLAIFGDVVPLSAFAKPASLANGAAYVARGLVLMTSVIGVGLAMLGATQGRREDRWLLAAVIVHVSAVALAGGDWMPGGRLLVPVAGLYALLVGRAVALIARQRPLGAALALLLAIAVPVIDLYVRIPELRASARQRDTAAAALAHWLRARGGTVALLDAGYLPYASGVEVLDLGGLTDPHIAGLPGGHIDKRIDEAYVRARDPKVLVLHSERPPRVDDQNRLLGFSGYPVEQRVAAMPWVRASFRVASYVELHPGYGYVVLERSPSPKR